MQIATHASELFSARGYHSVRMDDIAEASGITARALYRHYENKRALLSHVVIEDQARFVDVLTELSDDDAEARDLDSSLAILADTGLDSRRLSLLWQREARHLDAEDLSLVRERTRWIASRYEELLIHPERPDLSPDAAELRSWAVVSIMTSAAYFDRNFSRSRLTSELIEASKRVISEEIPDPVPNRQPPGRDRVPSARREQLIAAAARSFRRKGYAGVSIDDIGDEIGAVGPALYRYFSTKGEILVAATLRFYEWQALETSRALANAPGPEEVIAGLVDGYVRLAVEATDLLAISLTERLSLPEDVQDVLQRVDSDNIAEWRKWLIAARPDLDESRSLILVNVAKTIVHDCVRIPHLYRNPHFEGELRSIVRATLDI